MFTFRRAEYADADALLARGVRQADHRECLKAAGMAVGPALRASVANSDLAVAACLEGKVIAMFGVGTDAAGQGLVWMMAHDEAEAPWLAVPLARASRRFVDSWQRHFKRLHNLADPEHKTSLRWLAWLGFNIDRAKPVRGPLGHELYRFWRD